MKLGELLGKTIVLVKVMEVKRRCMNGRGWSREKVIPVNGSSLLLNARAAVPEESVLQLKGREKLFVYNSYRSTAGFSYSL